MRAFLEQHGLTLLALAVLGWVVWGRWVAPRLAGVRTLDAAGYLELRRAPHVVLDVRTDAEWAAGHPKGARHIPLSELAARIGELPKGEPIVCICASGQRSARAAVLLARDGFAPVYNFTGGFAAWRAAGLPVGP